MTDDLSDKPPLDASQADASPAGEEDTARLGERLTQQLQSQWAQIRAERAADRTADAEALKIRGGASNFSRAQVPWGLDLAAAWSWRLIVIVIAALGILWVVGEFAVVTLSMAIALLLAALVVPMVTQLHRWKVPRSLSALLAVILTFGVTGGLLTFAGQQVANGAQDLTDSVIEGLAQIRKWLKEGPLNASESQINDYIAQVQKALSDWSKADGIEQVTDIGTTLGHVGAGFLLVIFAMYFFLADGARIWAWLVRLSPRAAREHVDSSGRVAWVSLTQYVRATVLVALVDSVGIMLVAWFLGVPFVAAIGVLVFIGAFVPMVGATIAGAVAVLVAFVDQGPLVALFMLIGVIVVQQIEGNVLQPFLMGRFVSVHPLGILVAIAMGLLVAGIAGALVAVPLVAVVNAVVLHLSERVSPEEVAQPERSLDDVLPESN